MPMVVAHGKEPPDDAGKLAKEAYEIYRGMKTEPPFIPAWDTLSREERGLLEWVVRFAKMNQRQ